MYIYIYIFIYILNFIYTYLLYIYKYIYIILIGFIRCLIMVGNYNEAEEHLEFLIELQSSLSKNMITIRYEILITFTKFTLLLFQFIN